MSYWGGKPWPLPLNGIWLNITWKCKAKFCSTISRGACHYGALKLSTMISNRASLSDGCTPDRGRISTWCGKINNCWHAGENLYSWLYWDLISSLSFPVTLPSEVFGVRMSFFCRGAIYSNLKHWNIYFHTLEFTNTNNVKFMFTVTLISHETKTMNLIILNDSVMMYSIRYEAYIWLIAGFQRTCMNIKPFKPIGTILLWRSRGFRRPLNSLTITPRGNSACMNPLNPSVQYCCDVRRV